MKWCKKYYHYKLVKEHKIISLFKEDEKIFQIINELEKNSSSTKILLKNITSSLKAIVASSIVHKSKNNHLFIMDNLEDALYFVDDINNTTVKHQAFLFPSSKRIKMGDNNILLERIEVLKTLTNKKKYTIVTYPEAIRELIIEKKNFTKSQYKLKKNDLINQDNLIIKLEKLGYESVDAVFEPGEFCRKGLILDVFSFGEENPCRILFDDEIIEEIHFFKVSDQLSIKETQEFDIISNIQKETKNNLNATLFSYISEKSVLWINNVGRLLNDGDEGINDIGSENLNKLINNYPRVYSGNINEINYSRIFDFQSQTQPSFNKSFELLIKHLSEYKSKGYKCFITTSSKSQLNRLENIFLNQNNLVEILELPNSLKSGFKDHKNKIILYTDHQIFERHHQYKSKRIYKTNNTTSIKSLTDLKKGDYVTHFDYGVGMFDGLRVKKVNNNTQESIRIIYKNKDVLYISIHALHKIAKYKNYDQQTNLDKLGSPRWKKLKEKVKRKIKTVAFDLIQLYAKRKMTKGFAFSPDTYLQNELEASFIFQDTEDQIKITREIKDDMESVSPMDRLVCGDVGFGKTELAIRAAFKAVADNKQVAVLVPTTILALQHFKTFKKRLENFPCNIQYLNRFTLKKKAVDILDELSSGRVDVIIGTHRLISKDVKFKDLGLLVVDEEQKFGVSTKDKLKTLKEHVDTLTLTATPIPRTLEFSLMGSRDLSIMTSYPKNRNPIETVISSFNQELIKELITNEIGRNGQVFFVHNRVANIEEMHIILSNLCPNISMRFSHGQMEAKKLEETILDFIHGKFDVLITTTIIENGLDVPNANTIIINDAQNFGLADLHQMRGRVGRSNKKAFCYLLTPPFNKMKDSAVKRLNAICNFSSLGDGFNIAMKDLEIRGAGNMLGAEQSGFIEDMGFASYQKLLDEAISELKEKKFKSITLQSKAKNSIQCTIETDLELFIPGDYIYNSTERVNLYKRISDLKSDDEVDNLEKELIDRFGKLPHATFELLKSIKLRILAQQLNCDKIILKQSKMIASFRMNKEKSINDIIINNMMKIIQESTLNKYSIKENDGKLKLYANNIKNLDETINIMNDLKK
ncbi:MAG: transcription-repair coupling factor [Flavobacteriales bacterium]|nr:transcription-repair coupling factor [Flavobacteriales bacterium]